MTINNKSERNYRGKCLGWSVTSYGGDRDKISANRGVPLQCEVLKIVARLCNKV